MKLEVVTFYIGVHLVILGGLITVIKQESPQPTSPLLTRCQNETKLMRKEQIKQLYIETEADVLAEILNME